MNKLLICMAVACVTAVNAAAQSFSAATYNIRQLNAKDTAEGNGWERRLPVISSLIRFHDFDIFGAQEVFHSQLQGMLAALPGYDYVGVGRDDGAAGGEYSAIFYKRSRFRLLDSGHFWLSEDPRSPARAGTPNTSASAHGAGSMTDRAVSGSGSSPPTPTTAANRLRPRAAA